MIKIKKMKHYKILSLIVREGTAIHRYDNRTTNGNETGEFICPTLNNDVKIESDFCCLQNSKINSIRCTDNNRIFDIGMRTALGRIQEIRLNKGRGEIRLENSATWSPLNLVRFPEPEIIQKMVTKTKTTTAAAKTAPSRSTAAAARKINKEVATGICDSDDKLFFLESKLLKEKDLRLLNFYKKDLPPTLQEFLKKFFEEYNNNFNTIYVESKKEQTSIGRRRSLGDIYKICKYYYPSCNLRDVIQILYTTLPKAFKTGFRTSFCNTIKKRVFYYESGSPNGIYNTNNLDEFGYLYTYYLS
ncbi:MAG: hypothetical protein ACEQSQ_06155 [Candidatus Paceibacteria bacterium]